MYTCINYNNYTVGNINAMNIFITIFFPGVILLILVPSLFSHLWGWGFGVGVLKIRFFVARL